MPRAVAKHRRAGCPSPSQRSHTSASSDWSDAEEYVIAYQDDISEPPTSPRRQPACLAKQSLVLLSGTSSTVLSGNRKHAQCNDEPERLDDIPHSDTSDSVSDSSSSDSSWTGKNDSDWHDDRGEEAAAKS